MSKNLLARSRVSEFLIWCQAKKLEVREPRGVYQLAQIRPVGSKDWYCIYTTSNSESVHVTVDGRLDALVRNFIHQTKGPTLVKMTDAGAEFTPLEPRDD